jgi:hypothetical protein
MAAATQPDFFFRDPAMTQMHRSKSLALLRRSIEIGLSANALSANASTQTHTATQRVSVAYAAAIECAIYCRYRFCRRLYSERSRKLAANLSRNGAYLLRRFGRDLSFLVILEDDHLDPKKARERTVIRDERRKSLLPCKPIKGGFPCRYCKKDSAVMYQRQTRSADEPITTFYKCTACRKEWRE